MLCVFVCSVRECTVSCDLFLSFIALCLCIKVVPSPFFVICRKMECVVLFGRVRECVSSCDCSLALWVGLQRVVLLCCVHECVCAYVCADLDALLAM